MPVAATPMPMTMRAVGLQPDERARDRARVGGHDRLAVRAARAHGEGQQEGRQEERDGQDDVGRQQQGEERRRDGHWPLDVECHPVGLLVAAHDAQADRPEGRHAPPAHGRRRCRRPAGVHRCPAVPSPGRSAAASSGARATRRLATRLARTRSKGPPSTGSEPTDAVMDTSLRGGVLARGLDGDGVGVHAAQLPGAQQAGRHGQDARSAAHVDDAGARDQARVGPALQPHQAEPRRGVQPGPEGHARVQRHDDVIRRGVVVAPGGLDDDAAAEAHDREVLLPGLRPVLFVDGSDAQLADRAQAEGGQVAEPRAGLFDGPIGGSAVECRQVGADGGRGALDGDRGQALRLGREGLLDGDATTGHA